MSFAAGEIQAFAHGLPQGSLCGAGADAAVQWREFVLAVDESPKAHHDLFWYLSVGRLVAEKMSSISPKDLGEACIRDLLAATVKPGEKPYTGESEPAVFKAWAAEPSQLAFAYRLQRKCAATVPQEATPESKLATAMTAYLEAQAASEKVKLSAKALSFKLSDRVKELGMDQFPQDVLPSEESLAVFEAAGRVAREKGRLYVGSAEGEDIQRNFRPAWSRIPRIDVPVGDGYVAERQRQMAELRRVRAASELDYPGHATFHAHIMDWGVKLILMKAATPLEVLTYSILLTKVAEEEGGVRTAYQYDILVRTAMAKALERGDPDWRLYFTKVDADLAKQAKRKVEDRAAEAARTLAGKSAGKGGKYGKSEGASSAAAASAPRSLSPLAPPRSRSPWRSQGGRQQSGSGWAQGGWHQGNNQGNWKQGGWQQGQRKK
ncbi:unnamed protein product [Prorocentrum cordatum]|uniref:RNA helicase n=1 Tax=Prorocentrum cordatum TaxID=2364126 RepID=A0ABN9VD17_9DINO|nr:unnamed protein product [Polarella glacialis]